MFKKVVGKSKPTSKKVEQVESQLKKTLENCIFCNKLNGSASYSFAPLLSKALYTKYSSSQNYYYSRDINDIMGDRPTAAVCLFRDIEHIVEDEEYLKRMYLLKENKFKMNQLTDYYKFHKDIPRMFMPHLCKTIHKFHDKRRRLEYAKIKRQLGIMNDDELQSESTFPQNCKEKQSQDCSNNQLNHMLKGVDLTHKKTESQSVLRDVLNSMIKVDGQESSFEQSFFQNSYLNESLFVKKVPTSTTRPLITLNLNKVNRAITSQPVSPRVQPQPIISLRQPTIQILETAKTKLINQVKLLEQAKQQQTGAVTARESTIKLLAPSQILSNQQFFKNIQGSLTSRNSEHLNKLMIPLVQKQIYQQLLDLSNKSKVTQSKSLHRSKDLTSPRQPKHTSPVMQQNIQPKSFFAHQKSLSQLQLANNQKNSHFVQPVFQGMPLTTRGNYQSQRSTSLAQSISTRFQDKFVQSQPSSPSRPLSKQKSSEINIKFAGGAKQLPSQNNIIKPKVPSVYTINQNNIVNIYLEDKAKSKLLLSSRVNSPNKVTTRKQMDYENLIKQQYQQQVQINFKKKY